MNELTNAELEEQSERRLKQIQHLLVEKQTLQNELENAIRFINQNIRPVDKCDCRPY